MPNSIDISVNIDGLPLSKSSNSTFWPILYKIINVENTSTVLLAALYHGTDKPKNVNEYLYDFIEECKNLIINGIKIGRSILSFRVKMLVCDVPAKCFVLGVKGHCGYFSCTKCTQEGKLVNGVVCFPEINAKLRTDEDFRNKTQEEFHIMETIFVELPYFDLICNVPLDYMHLICLGVVKRLLIHKKYGWVFGKPPFKMSYQSVKSVTDKLIVLSKHLPVEFSRKTRGLCEIKRWKVTELRTFLLYVGPVVLKRHLPRQSFQLFLMLHLATFILMHNTFHKVVDYQDYANNLYIKFVQTACSIYDEDFVSHNVHNLIHLVEDVKLFGSLNNFSAFPFENFLQTLKKKLRKK